VWHEGLSTPAWVAVLPIVHQRLGKAPRSVLCAESARALWLLLCPATLLACGSVFPLSSLAKDMMLTGEGHEKRRLLLLSSRLIYQINVLQRMFLDCHGANPLMQALRGQLGAPISWMTWCECMVCPRPTIAWRCCLLIPICHLPCQS